MSHPRKWLFGLLPMAGILALAGLTQQAGIEADIGARTLAALKASGDDWMQVSVSGRDAVLSGQAPEASLQSAAINAAGNIYGVRQVINQSALLPEVKPYTLTISRDGNAISLSGNAPSGPAKRALLESVAKTFPGAGIADQLTLSRGAPANVTEITQFGLARLAQLSAGTLTLKDATLSLGGRAVDSASYPDVRAKLAALPAGASLGKGLGEGDILPAIIKPYLFEVEKTAAAITLAGFVPNEAARTALLSAANALGKTVSDKLQLGDGAPAGDFTGAARLLIAELAKLQTGKISLRDSAADISGMGMIGITQDRVQADLKALPSGFQLATLQVEAGVIRPYLFNATRGDQRLSLSGFAPDARSKTEVVDFARQFFEGEQIDDALVVGPGAPAGFVDSVKGGLQNLSRLLPGSSFGLSDGTQSLKGMALHEAAREEIIADIQARSPGLAGGVELNTLPLPAAVTLPPECQLLFNDILSRGRIRFETGSAALSLVSLGLLDRLVVVALRCGEARIEIGGHTDSDGSLESNTELSERRAVAVGKFLVRARIASQRLDITGYGPTRPVAENNSPENKAKNRRIEFKVK